MAKVQTRRSLSLSRVIYEHVKICAMSRGVSMAELIEQSLRAYLPTMPPATKAAIARRATTEAADRTREAVAKTAETVRVTADTVRFTRAMAKLPPPKGTVIHDPCRRERCRVMELHEAGSCQP